MAQKFTFPEALWAGTSDSLTIAMEHHNAMMAGVYDRTATQADTTEEEVPYLFSKQGNIGIVSIKGPLVNNDSPWNVYRGITSYSDIRRAMIYAATQPDVESVLLDIASGGGAVSGVADTADLIASIDKNIKPVYSFTDGAMMSAAYWLGASGRGIYVSKTAEIGSVGVIGIHQEYSQALKNEGVGVTVMRSGKYKALVNSVEPLTSVAKERMQVQLDQAYAVFAEYVASRLKVSMDTFEASMGQGRQFFGASGVEAGLAKSLQTLDSVMSLIEKAIDTKAKKGNTAGNYQQGVNMTRQALTEQQVAALQASGLTAEQVAAATAALTLPVVDAAAATAAATAASAAAAVATSAATQVTQTQKENESVVLVSYLQGQVKDKDAAFLAQSIELTGLKAKVAGMEATHAGLVKIAAQSVATMKVAMGLTKVDLSAMAPEQLLAEHVATATAFTAKFPVGGVAATSSTETSAAAASTQDLAQADLVRINRLPARK